MGTGKSSAAISYINEHPDNKFIYITPYLDEAARIKAGCPVADFAEPSNKLSKAHFTKREHTDMLIEEGRNITTTHQAFKNYTQKTLDNIRDQEYTLIIDENVDILEKFEFDPGDLDMAVRAGYINESNGIYTVSDENKYEGQALSEMFRLLKSRELVRTTDCDGARFFYWALPPELITSFKDVFILTYLFEGQSIRYLLDMYNIEYEKIGIQKEPSGEYHFCDRSDYRPEYVSKIKEMIHIVDRDKLNTIGESRTALSKSWFERGGDGVDQLKNNVYNVINNMWDDIPADKKLWGTFKGFHSKMQGKGYARSFLTFNMKATNQFKDRDHLVYITNVFMNANEKKFYGAHGIEVDEDKYALSIMVQWIWRSAIREGNEIYIYIPSKRMRGLLINWMEDISNQEGGVVCA